MARILIVEDSPTQAVRLRMILQDQQHSVAVAGDGPAALKHLEGDSFDLVITDIVMPGMSGYELCKAIKSRAKEQAPLVVLLSTLGDPMDIIRGLECGADNYITKPYEPANLISRISHVMVNRQLRARSRPDGGVDIGFMGQTFTIASEKAQILDLLISTFEDILRTHRGMQESRAELAAKNAIIETTLQNLDHGVVVVDNGMQVTFINDHLIELLGASPDDLKIGSDIAAFIQQWSQKRGAPQDAVETELANLSARDPLVITLTTSAGKVLECRQAPLPYGGFVRTYTDVTEQKLFQDALQESKDRAEEATRAKASFLAAMSHEIRTPMNGVVGIVELLRSTEMPREQKEMVEIVHQSALSLLDVINDILDFSKIEAGKLRIEKIEMSLAEVAESAAEVVSAHTQSKFLDIICNVDPEIDSVVIGDPLRLRQIILNIMGNAVKFTQKGMVAIELEVEAISAEEVTVLFEVTDTGIGISPKDQQNLFKAFSQADSSITRKYGGTGLGLTISKNLVKLMGGEIGVRSEVGKGSTFWFKIPFARVADTAARDVFEKYNDSLTGLRILVCDKIRSRSTAASYLSAAGAEVIQADTIENSIKVLLSHESSTASIDLVIVNYRVGDNSALNFIQEMRKHAVLKDKKVIIIAPHRNASAAQIGRAESFSASVSMPVHRAKLYEVVASVMGRASPAEEKSETARLTFTPPTVEEAVAHGALILVAEDNRTNQLVIKSQLQRLGLAAEFVNDGQEAWEVLEQNEGRFGLLLTDCHMPFVDGYKLAGLIRTKEQRTKRRLPIVALTANALQGEADVCLAAGMDGYLSKPAELHDLNAMLLRWLPQAEALRRPGGPSLQPVTSARIAHEPAAVGTAPGEAAIDLPTLKRLLGNDDPNYIRDMLTVFWETMEDTPRKLDSLARSRDAVGLANAAHAAKGAAASAGANKLAELLKQLQTTANKEDWAEIKVLSPKIDRAFLEAHTFIKGLASYVEPRSN